MPHQTVSVYYSKFAAFLPDAYVGTTVCDNWFLNVASAGSIMIHSAA